MLFSFITEWCSASPGFPIPVGVSKFLLIDGQQRLTTIAILLCAVRDNLDVSNTVHRKRIQQFYLTNDGFDGCDFFKLLPTQADRSAFQALLQSPTTTPDESRFRIAYEFFRKRLRDNDADGQPINPVRILEIIEAYLMVVSINLSDTDDPYLIFESLNFKGAPLEQADLVRNYFMMRFTITEQPQVYNELWLPMQTRLGVNLTEFMRHYLGSAGEEVRRNDIYAAIKRAVGELDPPVLKLQLKRIEQLSVYYNRFLNPDLEPTETFRDYFERFKRMDVGTIYPLLLSLYEELEDEQFGEESFLEVLKLLDSFLLRRIVCGVPSNPLSKLFVQLCKTKPVTATPEAWLAETLSTEDKNRRWPGDDEFDTFWREGRIYETKVKTLILETLEEDFDHNEMADLSEVTVEHIMPQTLTPAWIELLGPEYESVHSKWLHTLGNLTLTGYNPELSNRSFKEKREILAESHLELNKYFAKVESWGPKEIVARANDLLKRAKSIWPRPQTGVKAVSIAAKAESSHTAAFHADCIRMVEEHLSARLVKLSQARYSSSDDKLRVTCTVSKEYSEGSVPYYWFGFSRKYDQFLLECEAGYACLGCGSAENVVFLPIKVLHEQLNRMSVTSEPGRRHIVIQRRAQSLSLKLLTGYESLPLDQFRINALGESG
jgi:uncharacterized protein with ParB-like and HNH nuclease domain